MSAALVAKIRIKISIADQQLQNGSRRFRYEGRLFSFYTAFICDIFELDAIKIFDS